MSIGGKKATGSKVETGTCESGAHSESVIPGIIGGITSAEVSAKSPGAPQQQAANPKKRKVDTRDDALFMGLRGIL